jgi:RNA polymerase sigma factor (sigma-70 family)
VSSVLEFLRRIAAPARSAKQADGELLSYFLNCKDEAAFATLLDRHGPMVLGVCRRILSDPNDAEDAFQATFLVLVRKARSIVKHDSLASWLFGVARRIAVRARSTADRRRQVEGQVQPVPQHDELPEIDWNDLRPVLDEEVARLPERCRTPFILCYLQGRTNEEAASLLGCPKGTILSRLARARELLRSKLTRRGVTLSAAVFTVSISEHVQALVPGALSASTLRAARGLAAGQVLAAGAVSANVAALTEGMVRTMSYYTLRSALLVCLGFALIAGLVGLGAYQVMATANPAQNAPASPARQGEKQASDAQKLQGDWEAVEFLVQGKTVLGTELQGAVLRFSGNKMSLIYDSNKGPARSFSFKLDPSKKPKAIDLLVLDGAEKGEQGPGIYELEGGRLRLCIPNDKITERPTEFASPEGSKLIVMRLKRVPKEKN